MTGETSTAPEAGRGVAATRAVEPGRASRRVPAASASARAPRYSARFTSNLAGSSRNRSRVESLEK